MSAPRTTPSERPLSPHLQVYRWELPMVLSILHRASGVTLSVGLLPLVWWLLAAAAGAEQFGAVQSFIATPLGRAMLFGWTASLFYHLGNGIRHLAWDAGWGFEIPTVYRSGWAVIAFTAAATAAAWILGLAGGAS